MTSNANFLVGVARLITLTAQLSWVPNKGRNQQPFDGNRKFQTKLSLSRYMYFDFKKIRVLLKTPYQFKWSIYPYNKKKTPVSTFSLELKTSMKLDKFKVFSTLELGKIMHKLIQQIVDNNISFLLSILFYRMYFCNQHQHLN